MILVLRPEPGAAATVARARALGLAAVAAPLFAMVSQVWTPAPIGDFDGLLLTSANAVRHAGSALSGYRALPVYAVGEATAAAARGAGFGRVIAGSGDAPAIVARAVTAGVRRLLHLAGREHRAIAHPDVAIERRVVYAAEFVGTLPVEARAALAAGAVVVLHSPRAATCFAGLVPDRAAIAIAAISPAAADAAGVGWRARAVATAPTDAALLAAAAGLCEGGR